MSAKHEIKYEKKSLTSEKYNVKSIGFSSYFFFRGGGVFQIFDTANTACTWRAVIIACYHFHMHSEKENLRWYFTGENKVNRVYRVNIFMSAKWSENKMKKDKMKSYLSSK